MQGALPPTPTLNVSLSGNYISKIYNLGLEIPLLGKFWSTRFSSVWNLQLSVGKLQLSTLWVKKGTSILLPITYGSYSGVFVTTVISQGSVATRLRCGGQCGSRFVANFFVNSTMEKFRKSVNICQSYGQKYRGPFLTHSVCERTLNDDDDDPL